MTKVLALDPGKSVVNAASTKGGRAMTDKDKTPQGCQDESCKENLWGNLLDILAQEEKSQAEKDQVLKSDHKE